MRFWRHRLFNEGKKNETVLKMLAVSEDIKIVVARLPKGEFWTRSKSRGEAEVILPGRVPELGMDRTEKRRDAGDLRRARLMLRVQTVNGS
jgi:hypothetical protein